MWSFNSSQYMFDSNRLLDISFADIVSQCVTQSSHSLDIVFHRSKVFNFNKVQLINIYFMGSILMAYLRSHSVQSVQSLSHVQLFATPWTVARQASLSITNSRSLLKLMSIELVMPSNHLILCLLLLPPSIFPSIRVFFNESVLHFRCPKYQSFSFSILPMNIQD